MTINVLKREEVSPENQALFDNLKKMVGFTPNLYATFAHSPTALGTYLTLQSAKSSLTPKEREVVNLVVSQVNQCQYCLSAHTAVGKMVGFTEPQILEIRHGRAAFEPRLDALARFVREVAEKRGQVARPRPTRSSPPAGRRAVSSTSWWWWATRRSRTTCTA